MAHFAKLDDHNVIIDVNVVDNSDINDLPYPESEPVGVAFLTQWSGGYTNWKQTSYNANFRKNYASIGGIYEATLDAFIPPKPYPSWLLNTTTCQWQAPVPYPTDGKQYLWDENIENWVEI